MKARVRMEVVSSFKIDPAPANATPTTRPTLQVSNHPLMIREWTAELAGDNQRYDINGPLGRQAISVDSTGVADHRLETKVARIVPWSNRGLISQMQYDPREAGFMSIAERLLPVIRSVGVTGAELIERTPDETIAEIRAPSMMGGNSLVIECSSKFNFLPTRVYYVLDDGHINAVTDLTYQQVRSEPTPIWFLKTAVRRNSVPHKNKSVDDKEWGQVSTIRVTDIGLDAAAPPPRDTPATLPAGTDVQDQTAQPPAPLPVETRPRHFGIFAILGVVAVAVILVILVWVMSLRKSELSERG